MFGDKKYTIMMNSICSSNRYYSVFLAETLAGEIDKVKSRLSGHWQGMIRNFWLVVCSNAIFYFTFFRWLQEIDFFVVVIGHTLAAVLLL